MLILSLAGDEAFQACRERTVSALDSYVIDGASGLQRGEEAFRGERISCYVGLEKGSCPPSIRILCSLPNCRC